jgi:hypothetical protein
LQGVTTTLKEEKFRHDMLIEGVLQQLNNLASTYDSLVQITTKITSNEGTSNNVKVNVLYLMDTGEFKLDLFDWIFLVLMREIPANGS